MKSLLMVLTGAGIILTTLSTIWGLSHKLYTEDPNTNRRNFTREGKIALALALLGLFISFNTFVLKGLLDKRAEDRAEQDQRQAKIEAEQKAQSELARQQREEAQQQEVLNNTRLQQLLVKAGQQEDRDRALEQQQRDLALAQQQRTRFDEADRRAAHQALDEIRRSRNILLNINRVQYPLINVRVGAQLSVSLDHPYFRAYRKEIEDQFRRYAEMFKHGQTEELRNEYVSVTGHNGNPEFISFYPGYKSSWLNDMDIYSALQSIQLLVEIYKKGKVRNYPTTSPDVNFTYYATIDKFNNDRARAGSFGGSLSYDFSTNSFSVLGPSLTQNWTQTTGNIISFLDFPGALIYVDAPSNFLNDQVSLDYLTFTTPLEQVIMIPGSLFKRESKDNHYEFVHRFDPNPETFFEKYRYDMDVLTKSPEFPH